MLFTCFATFQSFVMECCVSHTSVIEACLVSQCELGRLLPHVCCKIGRRSLSGPPCWCRGLQACSHKTWLIVYLHVGDKRIMRLHVTWDMCTIVGEMEVFHQAWLAAALRLQYCLGHFCLLKTERGVLYHVSAFAKSMSRGSNTLRCKR